MLLTLPSPCSHSLYLCGKAIDRTLGVEHGPLTPDGWCIRAMAEGRQQLARPRVMDGLTGRCQGWDEDLQGQGQ